MMFFRKQVILNNWYTNIIIKKLNLNTLDLWSKKKTIKNYNYEFEQWYLAYRFLILEEWYEKYKNNEIVLEQKLFKHIKKLMLENFLNVQEKNFIFNLINNKFTKLRNIKSLIVDFDLNNDEICYFHYDINQWEFNNQNYYNLSLYLTNQRIVVVTKQNLYSFYFNNIKELNINDKKLSFSYFNHQYCFWSNKMNIIKTSLTRMKKI